MITPEETQAARTVLDEVGWQTRVTLQRLKKLSPEAKKAYKSFSRCGHRLQWTDRGSDVLSKTRLLNGKTVIASRRTVTAEVAASVPHANGTWHFCPYCSGALTEGWNFCAHCGKELK